ncbi:MAG TPA: ubiquinone biosynthesis protein UbiB, partial [Alphaproteobacteria bacterium]|nr:ubiquinone biosynthesis protein UbiB [Alphaproteobacteria bacterium]
MIARLARPLWLAWRHDLFVPPMLRETAPWLARRLASRPRRGENLSAAMEAYGQRLRGVLTTLGPTYIKLGQFIATRPDVVGPELAAALSSLQDRLPPFPQAAAEGMIAQGLARPVSQAFASLGPPIAAASIAQVHQARIDGPDGNARTVAVKVLRPGVAVAFQRDLEAFAAAARWAVWLKPSLTRLKPLAVVDTLARSVAMELDLRMEAAAANEMAEAFAGDVEFRVPPVDWDRTAQTVMTAEWVEGISLKDRARLIEAGHDLKLLAARVIQTFLRQALNRGFFHADMHPGNLFVDAKGMLVAVDYGITGRLDA